MSLPRTFLRFMALRPNGSAGACFDRNYRRDEPDQITQLNVTTAGQQAALALR
jgi:hypothetical protein